MSMKKNICIFGDRTGLKCNHPDRGDKCDGKCEKFVEDIDDLVIEEEE